MIYMLQISDFHTIQGAEWNNMRAAVLKEVKERSDGIPRGEKLVFITGDFHNFGDTGYEWTESFLKELFKAMDVDPAEDVFIVPGNHDVANEGTMNRLFTGEDWKIRQKAALMGLKAGDWNFMKWRLESFTSYCEFAKKVGVYPESIKNLPAEVHIRNWRGKLNVLHLNTALIADGTSNEEQIADTYKATSDAVWKNYDTDFVPAVAIGHNSFFDLKKDQQTELEAIFSRKNVSAYLCGDKHQIEKNRDKQMIRLKSGYFSAPEIPNIVCMKGTADKSDNYSEFGFYWHCWNEETDDVTVSPLCWKRDVDQSELSQCGSNGHYKMRHQKPDESPNSSSVAIKERRKENQKQSLTEEYDDKEQKEKKYKVQAAYFRYLEKELGIIQFDGIPTDKDSGTVKAELEKVFVPLEFYCVPYKREPNKLYETKITIGGILNSNKPAAILAKPGGGKSTLIRRIVLAYAYPDRKAAVNDDLPEKDWFPVYMRCRDLGDNARNSIVDNIFSIINRAELTRYRSTFESLVEHYLKSDKMILLIDGLDEISDEQIRAQFVEQLYTFVNTYPKVHIIITSRETGFRAVAPKLCKYCSQYLISDLDDTKIQKISENWHKTLLGNTRQAIVDSESVCKVILSDPRILAIARNPLLLTTLLFVKRWIGYLPTKKCQLYQEMIKLLLVSWNAAAHLKMDMDETEPQLAFVAYEMTKSGKQTIQKKTLLKYIDDARNALPELLNYTTVSPSKFIDQVEERSSILIQQGLEEDERGNLVPSYEFSHLSFQEYLAAKAISENWLPKEEQKEQVFLNILKNHLQQNQWWEVIPLAAVLLKRQSRPAIEYLIEVCKGNLGQSLSQEAQEHNDLKQIAAFHLANCVAAEVPLTPDLLDEVLLEIITQSYEIHRINRINSEMTINIFITIWHSDKYGKALERIVEKKLFENSKNNSFFDVSNVWFSIYYEKNAPPSLEQIGALLQSGERQKRISGGLLMMRWAHHKNLSLLSEQRAKILEDNEILLCNIFAVITEMLDKRDICQLFSATWCIAWTGYNELDIIPQKYISIIINKLISFWCSARVCPSFQRILSWAITSICQPGLVIESSKKLDDAISLHLNDPENEFDKSAAIFLKLLLGNMNVDQIVPKDIAPMTRNNRFLKEMGYKKTATTHRKKRIKL